jgi:hypothetical protein
LFKSNSYNKKYLTGVMLILFGVSVTISINSWMQSQFENEILDSIIEKINPDNKLSEEALIDSSIRMAHFIQERRTMTTGKHNFYSLKTQLFSSTLESFYIGTGACGYYSLFAARLFERMGFNPKIVQQRTHGVWGAHITLAIPLKNGRLGLTDPLYKHVFKDSSGKIADINSVINNWTYYEKHLPPPYDKKYKYQEGYRHTNWDKLGFITKSIYSVGGFVLGKQTMDLLCVRMWFIDPYIIQLYVSALIAGLLLFGIFRISKTR